MPKLTLDQLQTARAALGLDDAPGSATAVTDSAPKARSVKTTVSTYVSDRAVLGLMVDRYDRGLTVDGTYSAVWAWVAREMSVDAPWAHYRASQLARVGRAFERATGVSYATLCPGLPTVASAWVSDLA